MPGLTLRGPASSIEELGTAQAALGMDDEKKEETIHVTQPTVSPEDNARVRRKIDRTILPIAAAVYFMQYLDKRGLAFAAIFGLREDLGLKGQEYSQVDCFSLRRDQALTTRWAASVFYFGMLTTQFLSIKLLHVMSVRMYCGITIVLWGGVMMAQAAPTNATGLQVGRYMLGVAEGSAYPAFIVLISVWYRRNEHTARFAALYGADIVAQGLGGLLLYGLSSIKGAIAGWRIAMLIAGAMSIVVGLIFAWLTPSDIRQAWFLSPADRDIAYERVALEHASGESRVWDWSQCWETFRDPKLYICFFWAFIICACTVLNFGTIIVNGLGFSPFMTSVLQLPPCAMQGIYLGIAVLICRWRPTWRSYVQGLSAITPFLGSVLLQVLPRDRTWALTGSLWLSTCNHPMIVCNLGMIASNIKGHTRKSIFSSTYYAGYAVGCIVGPQLFRNEESPLYPTAMRSISAMYAAYGILVFLFAFICRRENARRDRLAAEGNEEAIAKPASDFDNRSDRADLGFRYVA